MGGSDAATGFPPHVEKAITGRLLGLEILAPQISWLESEGYQDAAGRLCARLFWSTNEALDELDGCDSLGLFLVGLVKALEAEAANFPAGARDAADFVLREFAVLVEDFVRAPYDPLRRLAEAAAQTAMDYYDEYGAPVPSAVWCCTLPVTSFLGGKAGLSFLPDIYLQVRTEFGDRQQASATVSVKICPRWLNAETAATLPRALLHEYIAHVPQGP